MGIATKTDESSSSKQQRFTNALIDATSPYLLQHAHNPVDWQEWSQAALERAQRESKMILISSGYAACHWCHVMAHESFENEGIAKLLNEHFVCIKVDREERPDIDAAYMNFIQATTGRGGWPMNVFLTDRGEPLFGGTYFSPPMFTQLIDRLTTLWQEERQSCLNSARDISEQLRQMAANGTQVGAASELPKLEGLSKALKHWLLSYDEQDGGFGDAPKFPSPPNTFHLLHRIVAEAGRPVLEEIGIGSGATTKALSQSAFTLARIARGGISDHLAGGVARYSVDAEWRVPHFEKMLYDQGQLLTSFGEALQLCRASEKADLQRYNAEFETAIEGIVAYLERYMVSREGALYAAEDADSLPTPDAHHAKEGAFYVWDAVEIQEALGGKESEAYRLLSAHFGIRLDGNVPAESDPHGELTGKNVLHSKTTWKTRQSGWMLWQQSRATLLAIRDQRPRPLRDDKIITAWNALAISGLVRTAQAMAKHDDVARRALYLATRSAHFLWHTMWDGQRHRFIRSWRNGVRGPWGFDVDHAFAVQAFLDLYTVTFDHQYLEWALAVQAAQDALFWDHDGSGGYLMSSEDGDGNLLGRQRGDQEGAEPTSTSVSAHNLLRLQAYIGDLDGQLERLSQSQGRTAATPDGRHRLIHSITSSSAILQRAPHALGTRLTALLHARMGLQQVLVVGPRDAVETQQLLQALSSGTLLPRTIAILIDTTDNDMDHIRARLGPTLVESNEAVRATLADPRLLQRSPYATVCQDFTCGVPIHNAEELLAQLG